MSEKRPFEECFEKTTKPPIKVKWKGDRQNKNARSRLVAKEINTGAEQGLFAATPLLETLRMLPSATVAGNKHKVLMFNDVSRAYMHARPAMTYAWSCVRRTIPSRDEPRCGRKSIYGTRAAACDWQSEVTRTMKDLVFEQGGKSPCVFWLRQRETSKRWYTETISYHPAKGRNSRQEDDDLLG